MLHDRDRRLQQLRQRVRAEDLRALQSRSAFSDAAVHYVQLQPSGDRVVVRCQIGLQIEIQSGGHLVFQLVSNVRISW